MTLGWPDCNTFLPVNVSLPAPSSEANHVGAVNFFLSYPAPRYQGLDLDTITIIKMSSKIYYECEGKKLSFQKLLSQCKKMADSQKER